jgi:hypothetical protein
MFRPDENARGSGVSSRQSGRKILRPLSA